VIAAESGLPKTASALSEDEESTLVILFSCAILVSKETKINADNHQLDETKNKQNETCNLARILRIVYRV